MRPPELFLRDLEARAAEWFGLEVVRTDVRSDADGTHLLTYRFKGGKTHTERTAVCRIVLPHQERGRW